MRRRPRWSVLGILAGIAATAACDPGVDSVQRRQEALDGGCVDHITADGFACCCGESFCRLGGTCGRGESLGAGGSAEPEAPIVAEPAPPSGSGGVPVAPTPSSNGGAASTSINALCFDPTRVIVKEPDAVIRVPGEEPIALDATCPSITMPEVSSFFMGVYGSSSIVQVAPVLPGCCKSDGFCGASTHDAICVYLRFSRSVPFGCLNQAQVTAIDQAALPPQLPCSYPADLDERDQ